MGRRTIGILREEMEQRAREEKTAGSGVTSESRNLEPLTYTVGDLQKVLRIGRVTAYELVRREGFPTLRLGKKILVNADMLKEWLAQNTVA